ncbi:hypothetical protein BGZ60DRAFT_370335 [Tricladium varicosporioides]|nr:hypothetical protein BGZ60DRAFT_370335 [Hymenoscyphus varicosporioides]
MQNGTHVFASLTTSAQKVRNSADGVQGEIPEVLSVFHACLQVGRVERAGVILKRVLDSASASEEDVISLHTQYLRASAEQIILNPSQPGKDAIHRWFELEILKKGLPFNAEMMAYMLKASLQARDEKIGGNQKRLVKRYMSMVEGEAGLEVLGTGLLSGEELNRINHICPAYNLAGGFEISFDQETEENHKTTSKGRSKKTKLPGVKPTQQKGLGLKSLRKSLSIFSSLPAHGLSMSEMNIEERREIQKQLEDDAVTSALERWREESMNLKKMGLDSSLQTKSLGARMWKWQQHMEQDLREEIARVEAAEKLDVGRRTPEDLERLIYGPFLRILPANKLSAVTILTVMAAFGSQGSDKGLYLGNTILSIAGAVEDESILEAVNETNRRAVWSKNSKDRIQIDNLKKLMKTRGPGSGARLMKAMKKSNYQSSAQHSKGEQSIVGNTPYITSGWPTSTKAKLGAFLMSSLIKVAKVPVTLQHSETQQMMTQLQPAISHSFSYRMGKKYGVVVANKALAEAMRREPVHSLLAKHLPMVVQPDKWTLFNKGGFIVHPSKLIRVKSGNTDQKYYAEAALGQGDLTDICKGLDVLGQTEWKINKGVFDVMLEAWNTGEAIGNIAPESPKLEVPREPDSSRDPLERRRWIRAVKTVENLRTGLHSQRCFQNFQLEIARALRDETFYFPHNMDFRGRAYPIPPYLNHMGADHCRGLLKFGVGKELGPNGLKWLKIQLANVFGFDKASLKEREQFADDNISSIYDSATNALNGSRWWLEAEDPWQCLAACIELRNALESPDPSRFISHLPVHQDGTCNGLQHYAALGGDRWGAKQVNLEPGDRPADVYSAVAELVKESIKKDLAKKDPCALHLDGKITRKTVKQTVMTNVYGVTFIGAKEQVKKQLVAAQIPLSGNMTYAALAAYIATKIFDALANMFRGAHDIQYWFGECANRITTCLTPEQISRLEAEFDKPAVKEPRQRAAASHRMEMATQFRSTVIWTTPLNMPVVQPYRQLKSKAVITTMQKISLSEPNRHLPVSKRKQLQGFPPNFVHSLDATHMLLSALKCDEQGLNFAAVHDSFWTHAADIEKMNLVLRDSFIKIHSEDVIGRLAAEFEARYRGCMYLAHVKKSSPAGKEILKWRRINKKAKGHEATVGDETNKLHKHHELVLERKRQRLLSSSNPDDVEEGKKIVTPTTIFSQLSPTETDLVNDPDLKNLAIGEIPKRDRSSASAQEAESSDHSTEEGMSSASTLDFESEARELTVDEDAEVTPELHENEMSVFERSLKPQEDKRVADKVPVWLPLTFPAVPKKGDFDVSRLKDSQYFFS